MKLTDRSVSDLLEAFRSSEPTPGGGSAAALAGAVGASLLAMVAGVPKPRAATEEDLGRLRAAGARCAELSTRLAAAIDRDSEAYRLVLAAYRLPKSTEEEKANRSARIQSAMRAAIEAPLDVMRACSDGIEQAAVVAAHGNRNASSDVQVGLELLGAGLRGGKVNVEINLPTVTDPDYAGRVRTTIDTLALEAEAGVRAARRKLSEPA